VQLAGLEQFSHLWDWDHLPPLGRKVVMLDFPWKLPRMASRSLPMTLAMTMLLFGGIIAMTRGDQPTVIDHGSKKE
jgi:hypothetical protein